MGDGRSSSRLASFAFSTPRSSCCEPRGRSGLSQKTSQTSSRRPRRPSRTLRPEAPGFPRGRFRGRVRPGIERSADTLPLVRNRDRQRVLDGRTRLVQSPSRDLGPQSAIRAPPSPRPSAVASLREGCRRRSARPPRAFPWVSPRKYLSRRPSARAGEKVARRDRAVGSSVGEAHGPVEGYDVSCPFLAESQ